MPIGNRKRRSESHSSSDEDSNKVKKLEHLTDWYSLMPTSKHWSAMTDVQTKEHHKSEVLVLDCKKLRQNVMLLTYSLKSEVWHTIPLEYKVCDIQSPWKHLTAENLIGFVRSNVVFWKDGQTLISANVARGKVQSFPSMGAGTSSSKWKYMCALDQLFAVNVFNTGHIEGDSEMAIINVMTYSFRDEGWEKLAQYHIKKKIGTTPAVLGTEGDDGIWLCFADYSIDLENRPTEQHQLYILFIENHTWGLGNIDCTEISQAYAGSRSFPSISTNDDGDLCVYIEPVLYTYSNSSADWSELELPNTDSVTSSVLSQTNTLRALKKLIFKVDDETCEFFCLDLQTGENIEHDMPPINIFQKNSATSLEMQRQSFRISNSIGNGKVMSYWINESLRKRSIDTDGDQFECEF